MSVRVTRPLIPLLLLLILPTIMVAVHPSPPEAKIHLPPISDTYILKDCSRCRMFDRDELRVGYQVVGTKGGPYKIKPSYRNKSHILIRFNLSEIPPGAEIKAARLWLYVMNPPEGTVTLYLHVLKEEYDETYVDWTRRNRTNMWRVRGGYVDPNYLQKVSVDESANEGDVVGFLVTDYIRKVHSGEISDYGLMLRSDVTPLTYKDIRFGEVISYYVDFYSLEGSRRLMKSRYRPDLYVEFVKPTAEITLSDAEISLERGQSRAVTVTESGTFTGSVGLSYRVIEAPGPKVGPLKVDVPEFERKLGFSTTLNITARKNAPPGKYVIEFYPDTGSYSSKVVEYKKAYLTVHIKGETSTPPLANEPETEETQQTTTSTTSSILETTESPTQSIHTTTRVTSQVTSRSPPKTTSNAPITITTVIKETGAVGRTLAIALFASAMVAVLILLVYLLKGRR